MSVEERINLVLRYWHVGLIDSRGVERLLGLPEGSVPDTFDARQCPECGREEEE